MKITVRVTKKLIEERCMGSSFSCPIHGGLESKIEGRFRVGLDSIIIYSWSEHSVRLPEAASVFAIRQATVNDPSTLKPITFTLDIPKRYLRKGVRG